MALKRNRVRYSDALSRVDATRFEALLASHFRQQGWNVEHVGAEARGQKYDGGVDLRLRKDGEHVVVQCKRWNAFKVPHNEVHQLLGVMVNEGATGAILATSGEFTRAACDAAARQGHVQLLDGEALRKLLDPLAIERAASVSTDLPSMTAPSRRSSTRRGSTKPSEHPLLGLAGLILALGLIWLVMHERASHYSRAAASSSVSTRSVVAPEVGRVPHERPSSAFRQRPLRPVDHEAARAVVGRLQGVRSAIWLDRSTLAVMVDGRVPLSMAKIDEACRALATLGDTSTLVISVQDVTAKSGAEAASLSRGCR